MTIPTSLLSHAGPHDPTTGDGIVHTLTAPDHLVAAAACIVGACLAYALYRRLSARKPQAVENQTPSPSGRGQG